MKPIVALILFHLLHTSSGKGLTMITRGCIVDYLKRYQLLNVSYTGPVPRSAMCSKVIESVKKNIIDIEISNFIDNNDEVTDKDSFQECTMSLIDRHNVSDLMLKNYMYEEEEIPDREALSDVVKEILSNFYYLCVPGKVEKDFDEKFPKSFFTGGYEKISSRICLLNLLKEEELVDEDFEANFEISLSNDVKCPSTITEEILDEKSEAMFLLRPSRFYENSVTWECAAEERLKIGFVRGYYRIFAYNLMNDNEEKKKEEQKKFMEKLSLANEVMTKCIQINFSDEI